MEWAGECEWDGIRRVERRRGKRESRAWKGQARGGGSGDRAACQTSLKGFADRRPHSECVPNLSEPS